MCFGPVASFSSSVALAVIGMATLRKVRAPSQLVFAASPLVFAVHQFIEGLLWNNLLGGQPSLATSLLASTFLVIAFFVWPIDHHLASGSLRSTPEEKNG